MIVYRDPSASDSVMVHIAAVGDIMLDRYLGYQIDLGNVGYPFERVAALLQSADITVGNVESAVGVLGVPEPKSYTFQAPPEAAQSLALAGFDVVSLANNHALDFGPESLLESEKWLHEAGLGVVGAGSDVAAARAAHVVDVNGLTVAFLGYVHVPNEYHGYNMQAWEADNDKPGVAWGHPDQIALDVAAARTVADHVFVMLHSGYEYQSAPSPPQIAASRAAIDAGAALVIGHHAHILQGIEQYNGGVIVYGLGNFAFEIDGDPSTAILNVWLTQRGVRQLSLVPAIIQTGGQPRPAEPWEAPAILDQVRQRTRVLQPDLFDR